jgi:hypothetical protein
MHIKPGPNFKLSKQAKKFAASILDSHKRGEFLRSQVQAELAAAIQPKREKRTDRPQGNYVAPTTDE